MGHYIFTLFIRTLPLSYWAKEKGNFQVLANVLAFTYSHMVLSKKKGTPKVYVNQEHDDQASVGFFQAPWNREQSTTRSAAFIFPRRLVPPRWPRWWFPKIGLPPVIIHF